jgi:hypothetical protein
MVGDFVQDDADNVWLVRTADCDVAAEADPRAGASPAVLSMARSKSVAKIGDSLHGSQLSSSASMSALHEDDPACGPAREAGAHHTSSRALRRKRREPVPDEAAVAAIMADAPQGGASSAADALDGDHGRSTAALYELAHSDSAATALGSTQQTGQCPGDFCAYDVTLSHVTEGPSTRQANLSEFRRKLLEQDAMDLAEGISAANAEAARGGKGTAGGKAGGESANAHAIPCVKRRCRCCCC